MKIKIVIFIVSRSLRMASHYNNTLPILFYHYVCSYVLYTYEENWTDVSFRS